MAYALTDSESVAAGITRILREEIGGAVAQLDAVDDKIVLRVHECRKHLKKTRSLMRVIDEKLPPESKQNLFQHLREAARTLAALREQAAHVECIDVLLKQTDEGALKRLLRVVKKQYLLGTGAGNIPAEAFAEARSHIVAAQQVLEGWDGGKESSETLHHGIVRSYGRARRAFKASLKLPTAEQLHEWRKRCKDLRYQCALIANAWPVGLNACESALHGLTDHLGLVHDLILLVPVLEQHQDAPVSDRARSLLSMHAVQCCRAEQVAAFRSGARIFAEKRGCFAERVGRYLKLWMQENPVLRDYDD